MTARLTALATLLGAGVTAAAVAGAPIALAQPACDQTFFFDDTETVSSMTPADDTARCQR